MSGNLEIALLGPLVVRYNGIYLPDSAWRSRQQRRLLTILLTSRGNSVSAERLIEWLWPEAEPHTVSTTLRSSISHLRHMLEPDKPPRASSRYIVTRHGSYAWNTASDARIDVDEFLACLQAAGSDQHRTNDDRFTTTHIHNLSPKDEDHQIATLSRTIELYRGDYLEDELDSPWTVAERDRLREAYLHVLQTLVELHIVRGEYAIAIGLAQRGLVRDPLREPLYRLLMRAQALMGDNAGALRSYERYRNDLSEVLGAEPSLQTRELHSAILRGEEETIRGAQGLNLVSSHPTLMTPRATPLPFVGRTRELRALHEWIGAFIQGNGGVITIVGEAGIGKTRLVEEGRRLAIAQGALVITVRAAALDRVLPFAQLSEALRPLIRATPEPLLRRLPTTAVAQVAELLPILRERIPDLPPPVSVSPTERHEQLVDGLVDIALAFAREQPLVLICDDAQWIDEATLTTIGRLARRAARRSLLIMLAYRSEELSENTALHTLLRTLGRENLLRPLLLTRFTPRDIAHLLGELSHTKPAQLTNTAERLATRTSGNPLFVVVAIQSLLEDHNVTSLATLLPEIDSLPIPELISAPQIRDIMISRLERLSEATRLLLEQLAIISRPVSLDLVEQLAGADALDHANTLLQRGLLIENPGGRLELGHDLMRSVIVASLSSPRRRQLHRHAAEAIANIHHTKSEYAAELAFHFHKSGRGAETKVLHYAIIAGDQARRAFGYAQALNHYDMALQSARSLGSAAPLENVRRAFKGRLITYETLLDLDGIMTTATEYDHWAAEQTEPLPSLVTTRRLLLLRALMGDLAGASAMSVFLENKQRVHVVPPASDTAPQPTYHPILADMLARTATILQPVTTTRVNTWTLFILASPLPGNPALELPEYLGVDEAVLALFQVGWAALMQGLLNGAEPCLQKSHELALETGQAAAAVVSALQLAHLHALRGDTIERERRLAQSLDLAQQAPEAAWASIWPHIHQGFLWLLDDQFDLAQERFETMSAQLAGFPAFQSHRTSIQAALGLLALKNGQLNTATNLLQQALISPQLLYGFVYVTAQHGRARLAALRSDMQQTRAILRHTLDYSARRSLLPEYIRTVIEIIRIERDFDNAATSLPLLDTAIDLATDANLKPLADAARSLGTRLQT
ncbi:MAG: transcriptional regulator [Chloroflexi bacterium AL-W]|nr:transcriptional regulator [Chloroflexi bacterium AL-N1]NOK66180.1 transcriptional regulator [Chloroflexi bacterium AL-N10]NOK73061.1 transcriptional regulator [Chloroflexi bacterium AL-N5]NOK79958.1 transcriptional regulator [Chloroflexi bacterium AL-W]NOK88186.1 transcriptional regulator [Chloroflexi bacterium AL-N15]